jgi:hypothetical protein
MERSLFAKLWDVSEGVEIELTSAELGAYLDGWKKAGETRLSAAEFRVSGLTFQAANGRM